MANVNAPFGARPVRHISGSTWNGQANLYYVAASDSNAYYIGDFVKSYAGADSNGIPQVVPVASNDTPRGIIVGILPVYPNNSMVGTSLTLEQISVPSTHTNAFYLLVADAPDLVFEIQTDSGTWTAADLTYNFSLTVAAPSNATFPLSATVAEQSTANTTNTLVYKALGLVRDPLNTVGAYCRIYATFNLHELSSAGTTAA